MEYLEKILNTPLEKYSDDLVDKYNPAASDPNAKNLRIPDKAFAFPEGPATYSAALDNPAAILSAVASSTNVYKSAKEDPISGVA